MSDLRTAAQQALEFCEFLWREVALNDWAEGQREAVEAALRAALAQEQAEPKQAPLGAWQPIETAPRDGTWVLLCGGKCEDESDGTERRRVVSGQLTEYLNGRTGKRHERWQFAWYDGGYFGEYLSPTHWMPMPGPAEPTIPLFVGRRSALEKDK